MKRLIELIVLVGFVTAWRFAAWPTRRSPDFVKATTDGVVRMPSVFAITVGCVPSMTATHEFVVPKSMPIILLIQFPFNSYRTYKSNKTYKSYIQYAIFYLP